MRRCVCIGLIPWFEVEIFDDLIPLADVPATGDISIIWYGATLLSLAGLLVLSLLGRKKTQED